MVVDMRGGYKDFATCLALFLIFGSILIIPSASASATELKVTPEVAEPGDTLTISGKASPGEEVWLSSSFEISLPVSDGEYSHKFENIYFPAGKKRFTVTAENVKNIRISLWFVPLLPPVKYPLDGPKNAIEGIATISILLPVTINGDEMDVTGKRDFQVYGDTLDDATLVNLHTESEIKVTANSNGDFSLEIDTEGIPEGEFVMSAGGIEKTVYIGVTPTPAPSPTSDGNDGGTPDTTTTPTPVPSATVTPVPSATVTPSPSATATPAPSPSPSPLPSPSPAPGIITVRIDDLAVASGEVMTATIRLEGIGAEGLSSAQLNLTYDPKIVEVLSANAETSEFNEFMVNIESGTVRMIGFQSGAEGLTGDVTFSQLQLKAVGKPGEQTALGLAVIDLIDNEGHVLVEHQDFEVVPGSLTITGEGGRKWIPTCGLVGTAAMVIGAYLLVRKRRGR
jgi:hypothetical protein